MKLKFLKDCKWFIGFKNPCAIFKKGDIAEIDNTVARKMIINKYAKEVPKNQKVKKCEKKHFTFWAP